jgi:hypothetical protein
MKTITVLAAALIACGGAKTTSSKAVHADGQPCTQEVALVCPAGQIDACEKAIAEADKRSKEKDKQPDEGGTAMALDEGRMGVLERAGNHRCVTK